MSASREISEGSKYDKETTTGDNNTPNEGPGNMQTHTPDQGEESKVANAGNRRGNQRHRITKLVHLYTAYRYFKGDIPGLGTLLGLLSKLLTLESLLTSLEGS